MNVSGFEVRGQKRNWGFLFSDVGVPRETEGPWCENRGAGKWREGGEVRGPPQMAVL